MRLSRAGWVIVMPIVILSTPISCARPTNKEAARTTSSSTLLDEFCGISQMKLEVTLGEGADGGEGGGGLRLFGGDLGRAADFESRLKRKISSRFEEHGIGMSEEATDSVSVIIYGRPTGSNNCQDEDVFLVVAYLFRDLPSPDLGTQGVTPELGSRIGVSPDQDLESALISSVFGILETAWCSEEPGI